MQKLKLPHWLDGEELSKLLGLAEAWWTLVETWLRWPLTQMDPETCTKPVLDLIAWQRDIKRFKDEPLLLYRRRVKFAFVNARDAGSTSGFVRIFERLGLGYIEILERQEGIDWDIIILVLSDSQLAENTDLLDFIIKQYGRTCRRYQFTVMTRLTMGIPNTEFNNSYELNVASI